jgi:hypothetical protein
VRLRPTVPRLEAALDGLPPSLLCPLRGDCPSASPACRIFAPGWYCDERDLAVFPELLLDADFEPDPDLEPTGDDEPDDDYARFAQIRKLHGNACRVTKPLDPDTKKLRALSPGELADKVGTLKARIAALEDQLGELKAEAVRRQLLEADGELFHIILSPPSEQLRIDGKLLRQVMGDPFVDHFSKTTALDLEPALLCPQGDLAAAPTPGKTWRCASIAGPSSKSRSNDCRRRGSTTTRTLSPG